MRLRTPVVWHPDVLRHDPGGEVFVGVPTAGTETRQRAEAIRTACLAAGADLVPATAHPDDVLARVHDPAFLAWLAAAWGQWSASGLVEAAAAHRVVPYLFPTAAPCWLDCRCATRRRCTPRPGGTATTR